VTTYGMTETCGGCVYDGEPLDGVRVRIGDDERILARRPGAVHPVPGRRREPEGGWFRTGTWAGWTSRGG